jgi:hypothetical protein
MRVIGWPTTMVKSVDREVAGLLYRNYPHAKHEVEREAFAMQGNPSAIQLVSKALLDNCQ